MGTSTTRTADATSPRPRAKRTASRWWIRSIPRPSSSWPQQIRKRERRVGPASHVPLKPSTKETGSGIYPGRRGPQGHNSLRCDHTPRSRARRHALDLGTDRTWPIHSIQQRSGDRRRLPRNEPPSRSRNIPKPAPRRRVHCNARLNHLNHNSGPEPSELGCMYYRQRFLVLVDTSEKNVARALRTYPRSPGRKPKGCMTRSDNPNRSHLDANEFAGQHVHASEAT